MAAGVSNCVRDVPKVVVGYVPINERLPWVTNGPKLSMLVGESDAKPVASVMGLGKPVIESSRYDGGHGFRP